MARSDPEELKRSLDALRPYANTMNVWTSTLIIMRNGPMGVRSKEDVDALIPPEAPPERRKPFIEITNVAPDDVENVTDALWYLVASNMTYNTRKGANAYEPDSAKRSFAVEEIPEAENGTKTIRLAASDLHYTSNLRDTIEAVGTYLGDNGINFQGVEEFRTPTYGDKLIIIYNDKKFKARDTKDIVVATLPEAFALREREKEQESRKDPRR